MKTFLLISLLTITIRAAALFGGTPVYVPEGARIFENEYIVQLQDPARYFQEPVDHASFVENHLKALFDGRNDLQLENSILQRYELGYAVSLDQDLLLKLQLMPEVEFIEANSEVYIVDETQEAPENWGLDRISHPNLPLTGEYKYPESAGEGVDVYVIDTGINIDHEDFGGRAIWGLTAPTDDEDEDGNGHGTHVASTIVGEKYGVAKKATVYAVKVLRSSGYGSTSDVLKGIEWAAEQHVSNTAKGNRKVKSVANMSLGGGKSFALDRAVENAIAKGVLFAVAAGNDNRDACRYSPAGAESAITVGASTKYDTRAYFSNYGECVDIFAPGYDITAAWIGGKTETKTISGTSMASPHVCGVMALLAADHDFTPEELKDAVLKLATNDKIRNPGVGSPNKLLFNGVGFEHKPEERLHIQFAYDY